MYVLKTGVYRFFKAESEETQVCSMLIMQQYVHDVSHSFYSLNESYIYDIAQNIGIILLYCSFVLLHSFGFSLYGQDAS